MRLSGLRLPNYACALFLVPLLACATVTPAGAEPSAQPSTQFNGDLPSAADNPNEAAEQPEGTPGTAAEQPEPGASAAEPNAKPEADTAAAPAKTRQSRLPDPGQCRQVAAGDDGVRRRHREIPVAGVHRLAGLLHAFRELHGVFHEQDLVQQAVGQRSHAARNLLHQGWARHPWQPRNEEARPRRFSWLRARCAEKCGDALSSGRANGLENTKVVLAGVTPGGEAKVAAQPGQRYRDADAAPWGYYPPPRGLFGWQRGPGWGPAYAPPPRYREQRRGWFQRPRGYY